MKALSLPYYLQPRGKQNSQTQKPSGYWLNNGEINPADAKTTIQDLVGQPQLTSLLAKAEEILSGRYD